MLGYKMLQGGVHAGCRREGFRKANRVLGRCAMDRPPSLPSQMEKDQSTMESAPRGSIGSRRMKWCPALYEGEWPTQGQG